MKQPFSLLTALSLLFIAHASIAFETKAEPWYQVEVIIFSQQDLFDAEQPRRDIQLSFPDNWLYLIDPKQAESNQEADQQEPDSNSTVVAQPVLDLTQDFNTLPERTAEIPYQLLDKDLQQLGPDRYTLRRAPGYRVLFHQAWHQPGSDFRSAPWVVIQGGEQYDDHFELEGAIRIVKSRHLHVQANLWKTKFAPLSRAQRLSAQIDKQRQISDLEATTEEHPWPALPDVPQPAKKLEEQQTEVDIQADQSTEANLTTNLNTPEGTSEGATITDGITVISSGQSLDLTLAAEAEESKEEIIKQYQVTEIVKMKQSLKLSLDNMGYLDHPNLGLLVIVNNYEPPSLEPLVKPLPSEKKLPEVAE